MANSLKSTIKNFPETPGVYLMSNAEGEVIYVGKATSLKHRVASYFAKNLVLKTQKQMREVTKIDFQETDSTVEAILLEAQLIKKFFPKFNIKEKDDKSRIYVHITREEFPRIYTLRETDLIDIKEKSSILYGPFLSNNSLQTALELIRKIIPYRSCRKMPKKKCLYGYIGLCSAVCEKLMTKEEYRQNIRMIRDFFEGKKERVLQRLNRELKEFSKKKEYEKAAKVRDRIYALEHLRQAFVIKKDTSTIFHRIEGYDVSNVSGQFATGSMVVFIDGIADKSEYRKFRIKYSSSEHVRQAQCKLRESRRNRLVSSSTLETRQARTINGANDTAMMKEIMARRFRNDWEKPDLVLVDGGRGQVNVATSVLKKLNLKIPVVGLAKGPDRKKDELITSQSLPRREITLFKQVRDEAHRFAKGYYEKLHRGSLKTKREVA